MDAEVGVFDELGLAPFAGLSIIVGFYMAIDYITVSPGSMWTPNARTYLPEL